jgi:cytoskeletal protein CcmA (bactofilin family)
MIVGEGIRIVGTIDGDEDLVVRGRVEGTVRIRGVLTVEPGGLVEGDVAARAAAVYGAVAGNVTARESIEVARSGQMFGDATAPRVAIVPGAAFRGKVEMGEARSVERAAPVERRALPRESEAPRERVIPPLAVPRRAPLARRP